MRLTKAQIQAIKDTTGELFGANAEMYLFGSRADDTRRGGDIDLFIEAPQPNKNMRRINKLKALLSALPESSAPSASERHTRVYQEADARVNQPRMNPYPTSPDSTTRMDKARPTPGPRPATSAFTALMNSYLQQ